MTRTRSRRRHGRGSVYLGLAGALFVASGGLLGGYFLLAGDREAEAAVSERDGSYEDAEHDAAAATVRAAASEFLGTEAQVRFGDHQVQVAWADLGISLDEDDISARAARLGDNLPEGMTIADELSRTGGMPVMFDRDRALETLMELKERHDLSPSNAYLDLEGREVVEGQDGFGIDAYASLGSIELAARAGTAEIELAGVALPAEVTVADLGIDDISHVLGTYTTRFAVNDKSRNDNLKLAASKLNGYVLQPGVEFSFNDVVGPRTEKEGYKIAHVITAGEMVDGLAGGTCQISSTLHGAAFWAGVGITNSIPHSRPSTYVTMGFDATVVYPHVDLGLRNDYEFPVVIHFKVARGESTVEILGKERPYDEIAFERKIEERLDFETVTREDDTMPVGSMDVDQAGFYGYKFKRYRKYYKDDKLVKTDTWNLRYRPVTEYVRMGINPDPNLVAPESKADHHGPKLPKGDFFREVH